jgi:hypothetical protein
LLPTMMMMALQPASCAASATACAWLPLECVRNVSGPSCVRLSSTWRTAFVAPRYLNAPIFCRFSHYKNQRR